LGCKTEKWRISYRGEDQSETKGKIETAFMGEWGIYYLSGYVYRKEKEQPKPLILLFEFTKTEPDLQ